MIELCSRGNLFAILYFKAKLLEQQKFPAMSRYFAGLAILEIFNSATSNQKVLEKMYILNKIIK